MSKSESSITPAKIGNWYRGTRRLARLTGTMQALKFVWAWLSQRQSVRLRLRSVPHPLLIRLHESDYSVLLQAFEACECDVSKWIQRPRLIIDAGANVRYTAVFLTNLFPSAQVLAIEPEPGNFRILCENVMPYPRIRALQAALWCRKAELTLDNAGERSWTFRVQESQTARNDKLSVITVPELIGELGSIDILKLDIEGAEEKLFEQGASEWLVHVRIIIVEVHNQACHEAVMSAIESGDYLQTGNREKLIFINNRYCARAGCSSQ